MTNKRKTLNLIISMAMIMTFVAAGGCSKKKPVANKGKRYSSLEELANYICMNAHEGNSDAIVEIFIPKKEYIEQVYPRTAEGKSKRHLSGEDFWRIFIERQRISDAMFQAREYRGRIQSVTGVGAPKKVIQAGPYRFLHRVPVFIEVTGENGKTEHVTDNNILGVVIQDNSGYRLFNVFR